MPRCGFDGPWRGPSSGRSRKETTRSLARVDVSSLPPTGPAPSVNHADGVHVPAANILLVDTDDAAAAQLTDTLSTSGYDVTTVATADEAFDRAIAFDVLVIDVLPGTLAAADLVVRVRATTGMNTLPILCVTQSDDVEERIAFLESGADDVMGRPFDARELEARLEALLLRLQRSRSRGLVGDPTQGAPGLNRIVAVFSPKGGVGTTTVAVNLAVTAAQRTPDRVLLLDFDLQWGQVATHLNVHAGRTIIDVVHDPQALRDGELLRSYATRHSGGVLVLAAPPAAGLGSLVPADAVQMLVRTALDAFDTVVIDSGSDLDERSLSVLDLADVIVLPVTPEIPALKPVVQLLEYLNDAGSDADKAMIVLNHRSTRQIVSTAQIEGLLGVRVKAELPFDDVTCLRAANEGDPVVRSAPRSAAGVALDRLATTVFGATPPAAPAEKRSGGLLRLRR